MLLLVRHGQSRANAAGLLIGRADSPLTGLGHQQAVALGEVLASRGVAAGRILTSPLQRAMKTAQVIAAAYASVIEPAALPQVKVDGRLVGVE
jgi:broad specificity phosphatase PhoE